MIYVKLLEEGTEVYRPVNAVKIAKGLYKIKDNVPADEIWEFQPTDIVYCVKKNLGDEEFWVAINKKD